jgi:hypothetical protein
MSVKWFGPCRETRESESWSELNTLERSHDAGIVGDVLKIEVVHALREASGT